MTLERRLQRLGYTHLAQGYTHLAWGTTVTYPQPFIPTIPDQQPFTPIPDVVIDHSRRVIISRPNLRTEPKLIVELSKDEKDVVIVCGGCGDRISLIKLLGLEAVKPIFDGISARIKGLIEGMEKKNE